MLKQLVHYQHTFIFLHDYGTGDPVLKMYRIVQEHATVTQKRERPTDWQETLKISFYALQIYFSVFQIGCDFRNGNLIRFCYQQNLTDF